MIGKTNRRKARCRIAGTVCVEERPCMSWQNSWFVYLYVKRCYEFHNCHCDLSLGVLLTFLVVVVTESTYTVSWIEGNEFFSGCGHPSVDLEIWNGFSANCIQKIRSTKRRLTACKRRRTELISAASVRRENFHVLLDLVNTVLCTSPEGHQQKRI